MKISILSVGKVKESYFRDAITEYSKRLSKYCKLEIIEVADEKTPDRASEVVCEQIKEKEAQRLMRHVREDAFNQQFTPEKFAGVLFSLMLSALVRQDFDPSAVLEVVSRTLYEGNSE